jgi:hypothetical protein
MRISSSTSLTFRPRSPVSWDSQHIHEIMRPGNSELLARLDWQAKICGDIATMRLIAGAHLRSKTHLHAGVGRERWFLQLAVGNTDGLLIRSVADLPLWVVRLREGLTLARIEAMEFGARRSDSLDKSFNHASDRISRLEKNIRLVTEGLLWNTSELIRDVSFVGDLHLCDAIATALFKTGDMAWGRITQAAHYRRLHSQPTVALEILEEVMTETCNPAALNSKSGSLCDIGCRSADPAPYFAAAMEATLLSLATKPNIYAARTGARSFKLGGRRDLQERCLAMWTAHTNQEAPSGFPNLDAFFNHQATQILVAADRRDLAELRLGKIWLPEDWANATRVHADTVSGIGVRL